MYWSVLKASHLTVLCTSLPSPLPHFNLSSPSILPSPLPPSPHTPFSVHDGFRLHSAMKIVWPHHSMFGGVLSRRLRNALARNLVFKKISCGSVRIVTVKVDKRTSAICKSQRVIFSIVSGRLYSFLIYFFYPSLLFSTSAHCFERLREHIFKPLNI